MPARTVDTAIPDFKDVLSSVALTPTRVCWSI
jgi:hypothetical protein